MELVVTGVIGLAVGAITEFLMPGHRPSELMLGMLLGIAGALVARFMGVSLGWFESDQGVSYLAAVAGAIVTLAAYILLFGGLRRT